MSFLCDAVIFDLDGILVDSNPIVERHWRIWAEQHEIPFERIAAIHHGRPSVQVIQQVAPDLDAEAEAHKKETVEASDTDGLIVFEGANRLLSDLPRDCWAIATSGTRRTATIRINHVGFPMPEVLVTADDVEQGKPAPDPYLLAVKKLRIDPARCVVVEDAPAGITSARKAGTRVIGVASTNPPKALAAADVVVDRLEQLTVQVQDKAVRIGWKTKV